MINKDSLLESLERCDWPLPKVDVVRLEDEINNGINYIKQAKVIVVQPIHIYTPFSVMILTIMISI